jgi:four helix bundle protein
LIVRQKADALSWMIHEMTKAFPADERFRRVDQMRSAASSIPMNIAEGFGRWSPKDRARFYEIAKGSGDELKVQLKQAADRKYCSVSAEAIGLAYEICAMLYRLRQKVLGDCRLCPPLRGGEGGDALAV